MPTGSLEAYQADSRWSDYFGSIVEMEPEDPVLATSIELNVTAADMTEGKSLQLMATVLPEDATNKTVTWVSSDESIATINQNGLVTAMASGTATITAITNDDSNLRTTCAVAVNSHATNLNGDVNGDGKINIIDVTDLINLVMTMKH